MAYGLSAFVGWALFAALIALCGAVTGRVFMRPRVDEPILDHISARMGTWAGALLALAMMGVFLRQVHEFRDPFVTWGEDALFLLRQTEWGATWAIGMFVSLLIPVAFVLAGRATARGGRGRGAFAVAIVGTVAMSSFPAFTGHAAGTEGLRWLSIPADTLHVLAAGVWVGGLGFVLLSEWSWRRHNPDQSLLPQTVPIFSPLALASVATLFVTGTFAAWLHMQRLNELWTSLYGGLISGKVLLVLGVMAFGFVNWRTISPRLGDADGAADMRASATRELLLAQIVLIVTAILVRTAPLHDWFWDTAAH